MHREEEVVDHQGIYLNFEDKTKKSAVIKVDLEKCKEKCALISSNFEKIGEMESSFSNRESSINNFKLSDQRKEIIS